MQFARVGALVGAAVAAVAATVFAAVPASAHTPKLEAMCENGTTTLSVNLTAYAQQTRDKANHIKVTLDGSEELENKDFGASFKGSYSATGDVERVFEVEVTAYDDAKYSFTETKTVKACVVPTAPPTTEVPTTVPPTTTEPSTTTVPPTTTEPPSESSAPATSTTTTTTTPAVVPVADTGDGLANTGASIAIPLVIGVVLLGGGAALLVVLRRRAANNN